MSIARKGNRLTMGDPTLRSEAERSKRDAKTNEEVSRSHSSDEMFVMNIERRAESLGL
jgi:hypothetical protein